ncbi:MAG TPA: hypothetical protein VJ952_07675, partial [Opitutales bacterium]|nr:hypothetical protein [Opitutales bacterium]
MKSLSLIPTIFAVLSASAVAVNAAAIDSWVVAKNSTTTSGLLTDSPTFGDGTTDDADDIFVVGEFGETVSLAVGDTLTVSYDVTFSGGTNSSFEYRFVLGEYTNSSDDAAWNGGWNFLPGDDIYDARTDGNIQSKSSNAAPLGATESTSGSFSGDSTAAYTYTMTVTLTSSTTVDLEASLVGGDSSYDSTFTLTGATIPTDNGFSGTNYNGVGLLMGNGANMDQASISGAEFTYVPVPEPSTTL